MTVLLVNCEKLPFSKTLGVSYFLVNLCEALSAHYDIVFVVSSDNDVLASPVGPRVKELSRDIVQLDRDFSKLRISGIAGTHTKYVEVLPHHFQPPRFSLPSVLICHDLHCYDIPWKYGNAEQVQAGFRENLVAANAVVTEFPRTYYVVERTIGCTLPALFLNECPLLVRPRRLAPSQRVYSNDPPILLYPAQIQRHKNHQVLLGALRRLNEKGLRVEILCPGSSFNESITAELESRLAEAGLDNQLCLLGRISDEELMRLYEKVDGVIVPSSAEGGALVALEGIAAGLPVALNSIDAARLHMKSVGAAGIWFRSDIPSTVDQAIEALARASKASWFDRNTRARERIDAATWASVASKWQVVINWLVEGGPKPRVAIDRDGGNIEISAGT